MLLENKYGLVEDVYFYIDLSCINKTICVQHELFTVRFLRIKTI